MAKLREPVSLVIREFEGAQSSGIRDTSGEISRALFACASEGALKNFRSDTRLSEEEGGGE